MSARRESAGNDDSIATLLTAWGKARPADETGPSWHPLVYHCLDVAAVTAELLKLRPVTRARAATLLGMEESNACALLVAFAALHDIGKFAAAFQVKANPERWSWPSYFRVSQSGKHRSHGHTSDGMLFWDARAAELFLDRCSLTSHNAWREVAAAVFGHHGRPAQSSALLTANNIDSVFCEGAQGIALQWVDTVTKLLTVPVSSTPETKSRKLKVASWWVAGLMTLSDWVGSNTSYFPYTAPDASDADCSGYWGIAQERAARAVRESGLVPPVSARPMGYQELAGLAEPTALQETTQFESLGDGSLLAIVEDATGSGKTEAAHMLVHRLLGAQRVSGAFWAMPTQATSNAMFKRQSKLLARLFDSEDGVRPSLVLAHGRAQLHDTFTTTVLAEAGQVASPHNAADADLASEIACPAFLADSRRKALLADIGVGTVDQAFLGVLPTRFNTLRLFAMAEKVLVLDEVHAFDEYMRAEAFALLQMQAMLGGSAVLLSATLPAAQRQSLVQVWQDALSDGEDLAPLLQEAEGAAMPYPLLTLVRGSAEASQYTFDTPSRSRRRIPVRWLTDFDECVDYVVRAQAGAASVVWIRNTVAGCLEAASAMREHGLEPLVFHARFTPADRQRIEAEVLRLFGPESRRAERAGRVLIATQVVEQSLDLDFDAMVSDLAPMDLLVQRMGRLWRHPRALEERPAGRSPELAVLAQTTEAEPDATWVSALGSKTEYVYANLGLLWRTVKSLEQAGAIETPAMLRPLIEAAYGGDEVPPALATGTDRSLVKGYAAAAIGRQNVLAPTTGYGTDGGRWSSDVHYPTRLGDPTITVRLASVGEGGVLRPWCDDPARRPWESWAMSEVTLRRSQLLRGQEESIGAADEYRLRIEAIRDQWPLFEREVPVVPLDRGEDDVWEGVLFAGSVRREARFRYSAHLGLVALTR